MGYQKEMIGNKLLTYRTKKLALKKPRRNCSISYSDAKRTGIIFTVDDLEKHEMIKSFIKKLKKDEKNVEVLCYLPKGKENYEFVFNYFTEKDVTFFGKFNNSDVIRFAASNFDYLFCLDCNPNPMIESVLALSKSNCRIGCYHPEKDRFYELMIQPKDKSTETLINDIYRYTKILRG
ncbi:MAG: DUF1493 family protein [Candidatus Cyclobacteriaceae bacterium M2_1C_046]